MARGERLEREIVCAKTNFNSFSDIWSSVREIRIATKVPTALAKWSLLISGVNRGATPETAESK